MKTLTLAIIGKNEEKILARGLESIYDLVDEIVYTDTGGTDSSVKIAKSFGAKIYNFPWVDNFGKAYTFCHSKSTSDYTFMWDTDFVLDKDSREKLLKLKKDNFKNADTIKLKWGLEYDEKTGELLKYIYRDLINKSGDYFMARICHTKITFLKSEDKVVEIFEDILVHHIQKLSTKNSRRDQNVILTLEDIKENPEDYTLLLALAETYIYTKDYEKAFPLLEKFFTFKNIKDIKLLDGLTDILKCSIALNKIDYCFKLFGEYYDLYKSEPAYILLCADLTYFIDKRESLNLYIEYIRVRYKNGVHQQDIFRNTKHPESMIEKIKIELVQN